MIKTKSVFVLFLITLLLTGCDQGNEEVIEADDNGSGKIVNIPVKPDIDKDYVMTDNDGNVFLKWFDTGLFVSKEYRDIRGNIVPAQIGLSVRGVWYPWGMLAGSNPKNCTLVQCNQTSDYRCQSVPGNTPIVANNSGNDGCYLANGLGIYILVAKQREDRTYPDPNINAIVSAGPSAADGFFTGHLGEFKPNQNGYINVNKLWSCDDNGGVVSCNDVNMRDLVGGKIYLKVVDGFYLDNDGSRSDSKGNQSITVNIKSGIYYPNFVSTTLITMHDSLNMITGILKNAIMDSFRDIIRLTVILYFMFTSLGFMIGLIKITQTEAVVRLMKIGIVIMLTTPYNIMSEYFVQFYDSVATFSSNIIAGNLPNMPYADTSSSGDFSQIGYLTIYDGILNQVISKQVNLKIIGLLFTSMIWCIPFMYVLIVIIIVVVLRSLVLYITAYFQMSILILILPIFAAMLLFRVTAALFQNWLKYMANSVFLIIVATLGMGLCLGIMNGILADLLSYAISKQNIWWFIWWWKPQDLNALYTHLNAESYFTGLLVALICYSFVEHIPKLADSLSASQFSPSTKAFNALWQGTQGMLSEGLSAIKEVNSRYLVGRLLDQRYKEDGEYSKDKEGKGILDKWKITRDKADYIFDKYIGSKYDQIQSGDMLFNNQVDNRLKDKEINLLKSEAQYKVNDYQQMIDDRRTTLEQQVKDNNAFKDAVNLGGNQISLLADNNPYVTHAGQQIQKDDIRRAISEGRNQITVGGNNIDLRSQYSRDLNDKLSKRLEELGNIEEELKQIRKN